MEVNRDLLGDVLEYPLVQYITLTKRDLVKVESGLPLTVRGNEEIKLITNAQQLLNIYFPVTVNKEKIIKQVDFDRKFVVLTLNYDALDLKYRTNQITTIGQPTMGLYYLFTVDRHLFYRPRVYFKCYDMKGHRTDMPNVIYQVPLTRRRLKFDR